MNRFSEGKPEEIIGVCSCGCGEDIHQGDDVYPVDDGLVRSDCFLGYAENHLSTYKTEAGS
jgi:hypothetical protein